MNLLRKSLLSVALCLLLAFTFIINADEIVSNTVATQPVEQISVEPEITVAHTPVATEASVVTQEPVPVLTQEPVPVVTQEPVLVVTQEPIPVVTQESTPIPTQSPPPALIKDPTVNSEIPMATLNIETPVVASFTPILLPTLTLSPEPTATTELEVPTAQIQEINIKQLYISQSARELKLGQNVNLNLVINAYNSNCDLEPFYISFDASNFANYSITNHSKGNVTINDSNGVVTLLVNNAFVNDGDVLINNGENLTLSISALAFNDVSVKIFSSSLRIFNKNGNDITPSNRKNEGEKVRTQNTFSLLEDTIVEETPNVDIPLETVKPSPTLVPTEEPTIVPKTAKIISNISNENIKYGDLLIMKAQLSGFENTDYEIQWQCDKGTGWEDIKNQNGDVFEVNIDNITITHAFRFIVKTNN